MATPKRIPAPKTRTFAMRVTEDEYQRWLKIAARETLACGVKVSIADVVREGMKHYEPAKVSK